MNAKTEPAPFVCFGGVDWWYHSRAHSDVQLMLALATERKVLFVNSIGMRMPGGGKGSGLPGKILRKARSTLRFLKRPRRDRPNFAVLSPILLPFYGSPMMRRINAALIRMQVRLAMRALGIENPHMVVTVPTAWDVVAPMQRRSLTYNRSDKHSAFAEADRLLIEGFERQLLQRSDHVLYVSDALRDAERTITGERGTLLDHGVDLDLFSPQSASAPQDIATIPHPRIGFFGGLRGHLVDLPLLERVAREIPEAQLVLIGAAPSNIDALVGLPNVHWLGPRDHDEIPSYGAGFDVALMPYHANEWIEACNPIKLKEYLALGLPIVSTDFPAAHRYGEMIRVASDPDAFLEAIRDVIAMPLRPDDQHERRAAVAQSSWSHQANRLAALVGAR